VFRFCSAVSVNTHPVYAGSVFFSIHLTFRHMAAFLIILYLLIPVTGFAHADVAAVAAIDIRSIGDGAGSPCDHCPCSDEKDATCCDTASCSCSFHSPPVQGGQVRYAPVVVITRHTESFRMLPQVYSTIYVPPQNRFGIASDGVDNNMVLIVT